MFSRTKNYLVLIIFSVALLGCNNQGPTSSLKPDAYERMIESGKLRVGYIAYPPSFIIDPNSNSYSGISFEILEAMAGGLGIELEFVEEVGWGSMIEAISSNRIDIVSTAVWPTAARGKRADFIEPIYYSVVRAYVRADDLRFDKDLTKANTSAVKIAAMDGEMSAIIAAKDFSNAKVVSIPQLSSVSQLLLDVTTKKADITFLEPAVALEFMAKNPGSIKEVSLVEPLRVFPNSFMIGKGEYRLKSTLDTAIGELHRNHQNNQKI